MQEYAAGQHRSAVADLKVWLKSHPDNGTGWAVLGLSEFSLRDYDNALIHLSRGESLGLSGSADSLRTAKVYHGNPADPRRRIRPRLRSAGEHFEGHSAG